MVVAFVNVLEEAADEEVSCRWSDVQVRPIYYFMEVNNFLYPALKLCGTSLARILSYLFFLAKEINNHSCTG